MSDIYINCFFRIRSFRVKGADYYHKKPILFVSGHVLTLSDWFFYFKTHLIFLYKSLARPYSLPCILLWPATLCFEKI